MWVIEGGLLEGQLSGPCGTCQDPGVAVVMLNIKVPEYMKFNMEDPSHRTADKLASNPSVKIIT
jgi:hypothetical protein